MHSELEKNKLDGEQAEAWGGGGKNGRERRKWTWNGGEEENWSMGCRGRRGGRGSREQ